MERLVVVSTTLKCVSYSSDQHLLTVEFHSGKIYEYLDVPTQIYQELLQASSKGRYFNFHIRNHFRTQEVRAVGTG
jgi:hypothetical protein